MKVVWSGSTSNSTLQQAWPTFVSWCATAHTTTGPRYWICGPLTRGANAGPARGYRHHSSKTRHDYTVTCCRKIICKILFRIFECRQPWHMPRVICVCSTCRRRPTRTSDRRPPLQQTHEGAWTRCVHTYVRTYSPWPHPHMPLRRCDAWLTAMQLMDKTSHIFYSPCTSFRFFAVFKFS